MNIVSTDERREVARRLREMGLNPWDDAACEIAQCVGIACCNSECHGSNETTECTMALCAHLADLIEPDGKGIESDAFKPVESGGINRDALLALASSMSVRHSWLSATDAERGKAIARRIREACGEVVSDGGRDT